jgi:hypothetical protein
LRRKYEREIHPNPNMNPSMEKPCTVTKRYGLANSEV